MTKHRHLSVSIMFTKLKNYREKNKMNSVWRMLDLNLICNSGKNLYTPQHFVNFFCKVFKLDSKTFKPEQLAMWNINQEYIIYFQNNEKLYHIQVRKCNVQHGEFKGPTAFHVPLGDDEKLDLDLMCTFLLNIVDKRKDSRGRRWSR